MDTWNCKINWGYLGIIIRFFDKNLELHEMIMNNVIVKGKEDYKNLYMMVEE